MKKGIKKVAMWLILLIIFIMVISAISGNMYKKMSYSELLTNIQNEKVESIQIGDDNKTASVKLKDDDVEKTVTIPSIENFMNQVSEELTNKDSKTNTSETIEEKIKLSQTEESKFLSILEAFGPTILLMVFIFFIWVMFMNPNAQSGNKTMSFGKSKARMMTPADKNKLTFADVAGIEEEKQELEEVVEFLKNPKKFTDMGARIPKGVLLVGHPGTGKTLLAKAVAGEAGVPFFIISGSDFVEMFVGVGASRVRDLFAEAKKNAPCIVFIDEIDAVGRQRGAGLGGGHDEREQTLNQLLVEMDGFGVNEGIIIIAATNRPDILDPALLRPGRFDRQVTIPAPDLLGREEILKLYTKDKKISNNIDLKELAGDTAGFTGAELSNLLNEAAIIATRNNHKAIEKEDIETAVKKITVGLEKHNRVVSEKDKKLTAYHEAGHAVVSKFLETQDNVKEISIIPRGLTGGYTMYKTNEDKFYVSKTELEEKMIALLGGRAAEKIALNDISTGASNDIEVATGIARDMITVYGMSNSLGPISLKVDEPYELQIFGEDITDEVGNQVKQLVDNAYVSAQKLLLDNIEILHKVANALLEKETISEEEFDSFFII